MRTDANGNPLVCETVDDLPLCHVAAERAAGRTPNPDEWETGETILPGPYPLPITCPDCLEWMHA